MGKWVHSAGSVKVQLWVRTEALFQADFFVKTHLWPTGHWRSTLKWNRVRGCSHVVLVPNMPLKKTGFRFRWTREKPLPTEESPVLEGRELRQTSLSCPRPLLSCWLLCWFWQTLAMGSRRKSKINKGMKRKRSNYFSQIHLLSICKTWLENTSVCQFQLKMSSGHKTPVCFAVRLPVKRDFWEERKKKKKQPTT